MRRVKKQVLRTFLIFMACINISTANEVPSKIVVITTDQYPMTSIEWAEGAGISLSIHNLDDHRNLEKELVKDLPKRPDDIEKVKAIVLSRVKALPAGTIDRLWVGVMKAFDEDITKAPVIIIDNSESIYGVTNLAEAVSIWRQWRKDNGNR